MKKLTTLMLLLLLITPCLMAQKKELSQARSYIKSGNNLDKVEQLMKELLAKDPANKTNHKIYLTWYEAVLKQYYAGNEKLYLKQKYDTASMYQQTRRMFEILMALDTVDAMPDKKGKVKPKYRKKHAAELDVFRPNLYYGGSYYLHKAKYADAFTLYDLYLNTVVHPMFANKQYADNDTLLSNAAYWATYSAYMMNDPEKILRHSSMAMNDSSQNELVMQYVAEAYKKLGDNPKYTEVLEEGFEKYPMSKYFFPHLTDYYVSKDNLKHVLELADKGLKVAPDDMLFLFTKSSMLLNMGRYDDCVKVSEKMIELNDTLPDSYYNAGMSYMNKSLIMEEESGAKIEKKALLELYSKALPYLEKYRKLRPKEKNRWGAALYKIYLNLNMGKQFDEIDKLLNTK